MVTYWPSSVFARFMDRDGVEVHRLAKKNETICQYPAILTEQAWSMKDLFTAFIGEIFLAGHGVLSQADKIAPSCLLG